jgi:hypothetical protein
LGVFSPATSCTLAAGSTTGTASCSVTYTPSAGTGIHAITGIYSGDANHGLSTGGTPVTVT